MDVHQAEAAVLERLTAEAQGRHAYVCFSGGLDSAVVVAACLKAGLPTTALLSVGPSLAEADRRDAHAVATALGATLEEIEAQETEVEAYRANTGDRCYHCKTALYDAALQLVRARHPQAWILSGAQAEDLDDYRPGMNAAKEHAVYAPLLEAGLDKEQVRALARLWNLPIAEKPASPCLASRFPVGTEVTPERLRMVDRVESYLRDNGLWPARARFHGPVVRVELERTLLSKAVSEPYRSELEAVAKAAGFTFVALDLTGLQSGSLSFALA